VRRGDLPFDAVEDYRNYVDGRPRADGVRKFLEARGIHLPPGRPEDPPDLETLGGLGNRKDHFFLSALARQGVEICEGAPEFIWGARSRGVRTAIVSSSRNCCAVLQKARLSAIFDVRVDQQRLGLRGKPAPDAYLEAAQRLGVPPKRAVVFEDALVGVEAGRAGGFGLVVGVGQGAHANNLSAHGANMVVADLRELCLDNYAHGFVGADQRDSQM
jgi:HAD superfamily hydrolase (TIGR01509 family)